MVKTTIKYLTRVRVSKLILTFLRDGHGTKINNVLKTGPVTEPEKLPVHGSLVGPVVEPRLNR